MNKKEIVLEFFDDVLELKIQLDKEMDGFIIESISTLNVILPYIQCFADYNDIIRDKISINGIIFNCNKDFANKIINVLYKLKDEDDIQVLEWKLKMLFSEIMSYVKENKFKNLVYSVSDCIEWIDEEYVKEFVFLNPLLGHHDALDAIIKQQEKKNHTPSIKKESFLDKYPEFKDSIDKDWLVNISKLNIKWSADWLFYEDYLIYYDDLFFDLKIKDSFISAFASLYVSPSDGSEFRIRLNLDKIISKSDYRLLLLLWWAYFWPQFDIEHFFTKSTETLFTRKQRLNVWFDEYFSNKIIYTDFYIDQVNGSFLIEEIREDTQKDIFLNRLIHSEFDIKNKKIKHFDWSILYYDKENIESRKSVFLWGKYPKFAHNKCKLFRIDWQIWLEDYRNILFWFYEWNEMVLEYLDLDEYKNTYSHILDYKNWIDY